MAFLQTESVSLHYQTIGSGEPVILLHGLGANLAFWFMGVARAMSMNHEVVMYDLRGHGQSGMPQTGYDAATMAEDLRGLMDHLGLVRAHVIGHSYGARVALCFAGLNPDRVLTLSVIDTQLRSMQPPTRLADWGYWPEWKRELAEQGVTEFPDDSTVIDFRLLTRLNEVSQQARARSARRVSMRRRDMGNKGGQRWREMIERTRALDEIADESVFTPEFLGGIDAPTLLLFGKLSHCVPTGEGLARVMPRSRLLLVPGAAHFVPAAKPALVIRALRGFIDATRNGGGDPRLWRRGRMRLLRAAAMRERERRQA